MSVEVFSGDRGPVLELAVDPDDLGKVIGRAGRVAQALRTVVRAGAESKVAIDILDVDEVYEDEDGEQAAAPEAVNDES
ncbi:MAG: KH domain-containing protein [Candidatus Eremiobacteraeota bacterium]|nr:KH domain-containing protein [Candidatus Eremiobacteraeota bacterium]